MVDDDQQQALSNIICVQRRYNARAQALYRNGRACPSADHWPTAAFTGHPNALELHLERFYFAATACLPNNCEPASQAK